MNELISAADISAVWLTLKLALVTTMVLMLLGTPLAWWLSRTSMRGKSLIEALIALPLVLPPTVLGFYLLVLLGANGPLGDWSLAFTFPGLVIGSFIYSLPFVVQPLQNAFAAIGSRPLEVAATLRASPWDQFASVVLPLAAPGFLTAAVLGFAHTVGEFGVVLMIGGNIPGETQVLSIAIYDHVEAMDYRSAHWLAGGLMLFSLLILMLVYRANRRQHFAVGARV
ncbi:molybdate ABC transporter permease subunit [Porticoccaceae bacterium LTM1]|nr:molybdate ABC transporter permease subunit [Porticoccaceae bacterium LTM1]